MEMLVDNVWMAVNMLNNPPFQVAEIPPERRKIIRYQK